MLAAHKHHIHYFSASECKPCSESCGPPSAQLSVQPHAPSGTGSSSSLSPASIAEDVFFGSTTEDQVKLDNLDLEHLYFQLFLLPFLVMLVASMDGNVCQLVGPPVWSRLKCLTNYWMDLIFILYRRSSFLDNET